MLSWMLHATVVSLLIGLAVLAFERSAQVRRKPARWLWGIGIMASLVIPLIPSRVSVQIPEMTYIVDRATSPKIQAPGQTTAIELSRFTWSIAGADRLQASQEVETLLGGAWRMASVALVVLMVGGGAHLSRLRRSWEPGSMAGTTVYLSEDSGPAVVGFLHPHIVVPRWLTRFAPAEQELVIAHERSHLDAHDTRLLTIAVCLLVCMPWNPVLWWQLRPLRLAIEIDCDARVLSRGYPVVQYGETLIAVGEIQSAGLAMRMAGFGSKSLLEKRIHNMLRKKTRHARVWAMALASLGVGLTVCAAEVAPPEASLAGRTSPQETAADSQLLDGYVGAYQYGNAVLLVTRDGQQLAARPAGQSGYPIYPSSNTEFFFKRLDAQISFITDTQGKAVALIMHRAGGDVKLKRIDAATAQQIASTTAQKQQAQSPSPGRVAALGRLVDGIVTGRPDYDDMRGGLAAAVGRQLSKLQSVVAPLGAVQSVQYLGVDSQGADVYTVEQEHGVSHWRVALDSTGLIFGAMVTPGLHGVLLDDDEAVSALVLP
jgi:beta-lactamase regulating signal transducer with metallopeptidase domain